MMNMRLSDPDAEQRFRVVLSNVVESNRVNFLEYIRLPYADKIAIARGFVRTGIFALKHKPDGEVYSVCFKNLGRMNLPCLSFGLKDKNVSPFTCSLEDASALASSWSVIHTETVYIEKIYTSGGKIMKEEVEILENDFRGQDWSKFYLPQEQEKIAIGQT